VKQLLARVAALAAIAIMIVALVAPGLAAAQDAPTADAPTADVPLMVPCVVEPQMAAAFPGYIIDRCELTSRSPDVVKDPKTGEIRLVPQVDPKTGRPLLDANGEPRMGPQHDPTHDQYTVRTHTAAGTKLEALIEFSGKVIHTTKLLPHADRLESQGPGMALLIWAFAAASVGGALFVVTRKNLIAAVMGMVGSFLGIAAIYMMLYAHFLAVVQMLVYAGAIMVLFVFVIMILNRPDDEPIAPTGRIGTALGGLAIVYLVGRLALILIHVKAPDAAMLAPAVTQEGHDWGSVKAVGTDLFNGGLFPFEAISILLLLAVVGAIAIARPLVEKSEADNKDTHTDLGGHA
jgi:NADH-quinone oxidoreductase subunit J